MIKNRLFIGITAFFASILISGGSTFSQSVFDTICQSCGKDVYPVDKICISSSSCWHRYCFKCTTCNKQLNLNTFVNHENKPYCKQHNPMKGGTLLKKQNILNQKTKNGGNMEKIYNADKL